MLVDQTFVSLGRTWGCFRVTRRLVAFHFSSGHILKKLWRIPSLDELGRVLHSFTHTTLTSYLFLIHSMVETYQTSISLTHSQSIMVFTSRGGRNKPFILQKVRLSSTTSQIHYDINNTSLFSCKLSRNTINAASTVTLAWKKILGKDDEPYAVQTDLPLCCSNRFKKSIVLNVASTHDRCDTLPLSCYCTWDQRFGSEKGSNIAHEDCWGFESYGSFGNVLILVSCHQCHCESATLTTKR